MKSSPQLPAIVQQLEQFYAELGMTQVGRLSEIYSEDIEFIDPLHHLHGLEDLSHYFEHLLQNTDKCQFSFSSRLIADGEFSLTWQMQFAHPKLGNGRLIALDGISHLKFAEKIYYHRDYYDVSAMLHDHIPVIGWLSKKLKNGLAQ
ncbi:nuclear transport factor 2 family protein [Agarivorans sp. TSD2052]|uniref:nuclear transport factor 2 family protein n=1 Tax=Agarivorans sp. TSD2052 TaxID=2937286 RepID=UPI00200FCC9F|nr:nuclear transport factor 2 family protein [Agarivorans sp. TSD2052]UPW19709.1 nuclear transport factor 2 family protein [Agarivorans sp. TSD2052]